MVAYADELQSKGDGSYGTKNLKRLLDALGLKDLVWSASKIRESEQGLVVGGSGRERRPKGLSSRPGRAGGFEKDGERGKRDIVSDFSFSEGRLIANSPNVRKEWIVVLSRGVVRRL